MPSPRRVLSGFLRRSKSAYCRAMLRLCTRGYCLARLHDWSKVMSTADILRSLGAEVGRGVNIEQGLIIQNSQDGDCRNLKIGDRVYIGPGCCFDLACPIIIEDQAAVAAGVSLITHADVGSRPLSGIFPRKVGGIVLGRGSWVGVRATVLHGVTIGAYSIVGSMSLVRHDVEPGVLAFGIPCRKVRSLDLTTISGNK